MRNREKRRVSQLRYGQSELGFATRLKYRYGISLEEYNKLLKDSEGRCAICQREYDKPFLDHDHLTKKVRRILCRFCNTGLGMFGDSQELLLRAVEYLKSFSGVNP